MSEQKIIVVNTSKSDLYQKIFVAGRLKSTPVMRQSIQVDAG